MEHKLEKKPIILFKSNVEILKCISIVQWQTITAIIFIKTFFNDFLFFSILSTFSPLLSYQNQFHAPLFIQFSKIPKLKPGTRNRHNFVALEAF